jgi:hypothetical protein
MSEAVLEELEALEAIYAEDYAPAKASWGNLAFSVQCSSVFCSITLPKGYPKSAEPIVSLQKKDSGDAAAAPNEEEKKKKKLSEKSLLTLRDEIKELIENWRRENERDVCCFTIIAHVREFVENHESEPRDLFSAMQEREEHKAQQQARDDSLADVLSHHHHVEEEEEEEEEELYSEHSPKIDAQTEQEKRKNLAGEEEEDGGRFGLARQSIIDSMNRKEENEKEEEKGGGLLDAQQSGLGGSSSGSRYSSEFDEIQLLGTGGYGSVWKCRNALDARVYVLYCSMLFLPSFLPSFLFLFLIMSLCLTLTI